MKDKWAALEFKHLTLWIAGVEKSVPRLPAVEVDCAAASDKAEKGVVNRFGKGDIVASIHDDTGAGKGLGVGDGERLDLHVVAIGAGAGIAGGQNILDGFAFSQFDEEVEPVDAGIDDVPAGALDFDQFQLADLAAVNALEDLRAVVCYEEAMGYGYWEISGAY